MSTRFMLGLKTLLPTSKGKVKKTLAADRGHAGGAMAFEADVLPARKKPAKAKPKAIKAVSK